MAIDSDGGEFALAWQRMMLLKAKTVGNSIELKMEMQYSSGKGVKEERESRERM